MSFLFENLNVYNLSLEFHDKIIKLCKNNSMRGFYHLVDQLKRASLSISLNIAEGNGRFHKNDRRNFFLIARWSAFECVPVLSIFLRNKLISNTEADELRDDIDHISKMLTGLIKRSETRKT
jgi:four helix bundle protein